MKTRWILFFDGACPLCLKSQYKISKLISPQIKLTTVDLNGPIATSKGYSNKEIVLEANSEVYFGYKAWVKLLSETKYSFLSHLIFRPIIIVTYFFISRNRKLISKLI